MKEVDIFLIEIGRRLREHRESIGRNIELVALECEISVSDIRAIEEGNDAELFTYVELLDYYELPRSFLFDCNITRN